MEKIKVIFEVFATNGTTAEYEDFESLEDARTCARVIVQILHKIQLKPSVIVWKEIFDGSYEKVGVASMNKEEGA